MRKAYIFLILGIWLAVVPYLGFSYFWKGILTTLSGLVLILVSYIFYREAKRQDIMAGRSFDNFSENEPITEEIKKIKEEIIKTLQDKV